MIETDRWPLTRLFEQMHDAVYLLDPLSSNVLWTNRAGWEMLGLGADEVLDHSVLSLQKDVVGLPQWAEIAQVIRSQSPYVFVGHRHRDGHGIGIRDGHEVPVEVQTTCFVHGGRERLANADVALSRAKVNGRDRVEFASGPLCTTD
jgi:PAS domain-containing protein